MKPMSREELSSLGLINKPPYFYLSSIMNDLINGRESVKLFHSHVYYVRAAIEKRTNLVYPLPMVDRMMRECGWDKK